MIDFKCRKCGEEMEAPEGLAGETLECPVCGSVCRVPPQSVIASPASTAATTCLDCGYKMESGATRCSHCGSPVYLMTYEDHPLAHQILLEWLAIDPTTKLRCFGCERKISLAGLPTSTMKCPFCGFIPSPRVCQALLRVLEGRRQRQLASPQRLRAVTRIAERVAAMNGPKERGECSRCRAAERSLRETEDKQWVCLPCYHQLYTALATERQIYNLRRAGINVPDDLTAREGRRLWVLHAVRKLGLSLPDDKPLAEVLPSDPIHDLNVALGLAHGGPTNAGRDAPLSHFYAKVAGVTHKNDDGSDRQEILSMCSPLQMLRVEHEGNNPHDPNAIRISTEDGQQIGYLFRHEASNLCVRMRRNFTHLAVSANITGGTKNKPFLGMTIVCLVGRPGVSQEEMQAYLVRIMPAVAADVYDYNPDDYDTDDNDDDEQGG